MRPRVSSPARSLLQCHPSCQFCWGDSHVVGTAHDCVKCSSPKLFSPGPNHDTDGRGQCIGACCGVFVCLLTCLLCSGCDLRRAPMRLDLMGPRPYVQPTFACTDRAKGFKSTCPPTHPSCQASNQCRTCDKSCLMCNNDRKVACGPEDCVECRQGWTLVTTAKKKSGVCRSMSWPTLVALSVGARAHGASLALMYTACLLPFAPSTTLRGVFCPILLISGSYRCHLVTKVTANSKSKGRTKNKGEETSHFDTPSGAPALMDTFVFLSGYSVVVSAARCLHALFWVW